MILETIIYDVADAVATITFNRPDALNATNDQFYREMQGLIREIASDDEVGADVRPGEKNSESWTHPRLMPEAVEHDGGPICCRSASRRGEWTPST